VHLGRPAVEEHGDELARRVRANDRVVDDDDPAALDLVQGVELHPDPLLAHRLVGLDEGARDIAVLDQALVERDPGRLREADRGWGAGVGDADDEVGLDRSLLCQPLAHAHA
jgi:hypothetical protein